MDSRRGGLAGGSSHLDIDLKAHTLDRGPLLTVGKPREGEGSHEKKGSPQ